MKYISVGPTFVALYIMLMLPTYLLPYMQPPPAAASGVFMTSVTLLHLCCLMCLCFIAYVRGIYTGKIWIVTLPILALLFDLTPVLNWIPFIPTVLHITTLVIGTVNKSTTMPGEN